MIEEVIRSKACVSLGLTSIIASAMKGYADAKSIPIDNKFLEAVAIYGPIVAGGLTGGYLGLLAGIGDEDNGTVGRLAGY